MGKTIISQGEVGYIGITSIEGFGWYLMVIPKEKPSIIVIIVGGREDEDKESRGSKG